MEPTNYNSAIATFCHNLANDLPIKVNDEKTGLELVYVDDLMSHICSCLLNAKEETCRGGSEVADLQFDGW